MYSYVQIDINLRYVMQRNGWSKSRLHFLTERSRGFNAQRAFLFFSFLHRILSQLFLLGTACAFTTEYLDLIDCNYTTELHAAVRRTSMHLYIPAMYFCCCCSVCCYTDVAAAAAACCCSCCCMLLLFVIVCRMATFVVVVHCI